VSKGKIKVFTSLAVNYLPKARILIDSIIQHHPEWDIYIALADEIPKNCPVDNYLEGVRDIVPVRNLGISNWKSWVFMHDIVELATAIKPFMLLKLLSMPETEAVIYFDPDIVIFSRLDDIVEMGEEASILLTPHLTKPERTLEAIIDNEICSLKHGVYNLGFIYVRNTDEGWKFAEWWAERLYYFCQADTFYGLFTDQRWIDLVPVFFDSVKIIKDSRHNVAAWNLTTRYLTYENGKFFVDGRPLGFYHFTGFDKGDHKAMIMKYAYTNEAVIRLYEWYSTKISTLTRDHLTELPWALGYYSDGTPIKKIHRIIYRKRKDLQEAYPDPFDVDTYYRWLQTQGKFEYPELDL